jgi:hypothetical protein
MARLRSTVARILADGDELHLRLAAVDPERRTIGFEAMD